ncbi:HAD family hydrolase [Pendulispora albinea]|uniref:HAD family hydrolase n=1 Tax=Pendulispora albinea TaxID=2741071 RepID=A0ABZ2LQM3_9BACT
MRALLLDLDDTLYDYAPVERRARAWLLAQVAGDLKLPLGEVESLFDAARAKVKERVGKVAASHSRLLYVSELVYAANRPDALRLVRGWERGFWETYLRAATLRAGARELLVGWRAQGNKVAMVTDLILEVQLSKLEAFGLFELVDVLVASEEVAREKPARDPFELAIQRLGVPKEACVVVGDSVHRDGEGARAMGLPYLRAQSSESPGEGMSLEDIARALQVVP